MRLDKNLFLVDIEEFTNETKMNIDLDSFNIPWTKSDLGYLYSGESRERALNSQFRIDFETHHPNAEINIDFLISTSEDVGSIKFYLDNNEDSYDVPDISETGVIEDIQTAKITIPDAGEHYVIVSYEREGFTETGLDGAEVHEVRLYELMTQEQYDDLFIFETKTETRKVTVPFEIQYRDNYEMEIGEENILEEGVNGEKLVTEEINFLNGVETGRFVISEEIITPPVTQLVERGAELYVPDSTMQHIVTERITEFTSEELRSYSGNGKPWETMDSENDKLPISPSDLRTTGTYTIIVPIETETDHSKIEVGYRHYGNTSSLRIYLNDEDNFIELSHFSSRSLSRTVEFDIPEAGRNRIRIDFIQNADETTWETTSAFIDWINVLSLVEIPNEVEMIKDVPLGDKIIMDLIPNREGLESVSWTVVSQEHYKKNNRYPEEDRSPTYATTLLSDDIIDIIRHNFTSRKFYYSAVGNSLRNFYKNIPNNIKGVTLESRKSFIPTGTGVNAGGDNEIGIGGGLMNLFIPSYGELGGSLRRIEDPRGTNVWFYFRRGTSFDYQGDMLSVNPSREELIDKYNEGQDWAGYQKEYGDFIPYFTRETSRTMYNPEQYLPIYGIGKDNDIRWSYLTPENGNGWAGIRPAMHIDQKAKVELVEEGVYRIIEESKDDSNDIISSEVWRRTTTTDFKTIEIKEPTMELGERIVLRKGVKGTRVERYRLIKYSNGYEERITLSVETTLPEDETVLVGTKKPEVDDETSDEIDKIVEDIENDTKYKYEKKREEVGEPLPFRTEYRNSYELDAGEERVLREGVEGVLNRIYTVSYIDEVEQSRVQIGTKIIEEAINKIVEVGVEVEEPSGDREFVLVKRIDKVSEYEMQWWKQEGTGSWDLIGEDRRLPLKLNNAGIKGKTRIEIPFKVPISLGPSSMKVELGYFYSDPNSTSVEDGEETSNLNVYVNDNPQPFSIRNSSIGTARTIEFVLPKVKENTITLEFDQRNENITDDDINVSIEWINVFRLFNKLDEGSGLTRIKNVPEGSRITLDLFPDGAMPKFSYWTLVDHNRSQYNDRYPDTDQNPNYATTLLSNEIVDVVSWKDNVEMSEHEFNSIKFSETEIGKGLKRFEDKLPNYLLGRLIESKTSFIPFESRIPNTPDDKFEDGYLSEWTKLSIPALGEIRSQETWSENTLLQREFAYGGNPIRTTTTPKNEIIDSFNRLALEGMGNGLTLKEYGDSVEFFIREAGKRFNSSTNKHLLYPIYLNNNTPDGSAYATASSRLVAGIRPLIHIEPDTVVRYVRDGEYRVVDSLEYSIQPNPIVDYRDEDKIEDYNFQTLLVKEPTLKKGVEVVSQEGEKGKVRRTYRTDIYRDKKETTYTINVEVVEPAVDKIILVGTKEPDGWLPRTESRIWFKDEHLPIKDIYRENPDLYVGQIVRVYGTTEPRAGFRRNRFVTNTLRSGEEFTYFDGHYYVVHPVHRYYDVGTKVGGDVDWNPPVSPDGGRDKKKHILNNYIYLLNSENLEVDNIVDNYGSFSMTINYKSVGEFVIEIDNRLDSAKDMYIDRIIQFGASHRFVGIITRTEFSIDEEGNEIKVIKGRTIGDLLSRRVIWMPKTHPVKRYEGKSETIIKDVITDNIINPEDPDRKINNFTVRESKELGKDTFREYVYNSIEEVTEDLVSGENFGWEVFLDDDENELVFDILIGRDHSLSQEENPQVLFSSELGNIESQEYIDDESSHKNYVYIETYSSLWSNTPSDWNQMGEEGVSGIDRKEGYTKADTYRPELFPPDSPQYGVYPETIGEWYLTDTSPIQNFDAKAIDGQIYTYGEDYDIGDIVSIENKDWGIEVDLRIISVTVESSGEGMDFDVYLTFGDKIPRLTDRVKYEIENYDETAHTGRRLVTSDELRSAVVTEQRIREIIRQETSGGGGWGGGF